MQMLSKDELYNENEKLIYQTVYKKYNNKKFLQFHGLSEDDQIQFGRIGLWEAIETYDPNRNTAFQTHAINRIKGRIQMETRKDSLSNKNNSTLETIEKMSFDSPIHNEHDETMTLGDVLVSPDNAIEEMEIQMAIDSLEGKVSDNLLKIIRLRMQDKTDREIAKELGISFQRVSKILVDNREKLRGLLLAS